METPHDWDEFASLYNAIQNESTLSIEEDVIAELRRQHLLPAITVMDLASGSGRFALPLAQYSDKVILLDWSKEMLRLAQQAAATAQITNLTYRVADWRTLPKAPQAELVFINQLPTLAPSNLAHVTHLAQHAVALNHQVKQDDTLLTAIYQWLKQPVPRPYQVDPDLMHQYADWLTAHHFTFTATSFTYTRTEQTSIADLLPDIDHAFSLSSAQQLAEALTGQSNPNALTETTITYQYQLLTWLSEQH